MKIEFPGKRKKRLSYPGSQNFLDAVDEAFADQANVAVFSIKKGQFEDVEFVDFDTLVRESDILSIHVGLNKETFHKFNHETFRQMKNNALIINTARGPIIDQKALAEALISGEIRGAGLEHGRK